MFDQLKTLFRHTAIYGLGDVINRLAAFLLIPLYTNYLTPSEFGSLELLYVTSAIISMFLGRQLSHGTLRFYFEYDNEQERRALISTSFSLAFLFSGICLLFCTLLSKHFSKLVFSNYDYALHFGLIFGTLLLELSNEILFAYIRALEYSIFFITLSFLGLIIRLALTIYLVIYIDLNILGVLIGNLTGIMTVWLILSFYTLYNCGIQIDLTKAADLIKYTLPLIFVGFSGLIIRNVDKFILKSYVSLFAVGIYAIGFRFKSVLNFMVINPFTRGYGPFRFSIMKQSDAKEIYARVTTYFFLLLCWISLALAMLSKEVIEIISKESYYSAYHVIPILLIAGISQGLYYMFQIGVYINKNTEVLAKLYAVAAVVNIALLFIFVPIFKEIGVATIHASTHVFIAFGGLWFSQKSYPISYEWDRMAKLGAIAIVLFFSSFLFPNSSLIVSIFYKSVLLILYPTILYFAGFFKSEELIKINDITKNLGINLLKVISSKT